MALRTVACVSLIGEVPFGTPFGHVARAKDRIMNGIVYLAGFAVVVPTGTRHNIVNTGSVPMKLYTIYAPPNHRDGVVHRTRAEADADKEHFDGKTTE
jgi:oxalate decarboxylase/phosphoglucose isomerase-like protein (cupin superfamily)